MTKDYTGPAWDNSTEYASLSAPELLQDLAKVQTLIVELEGLSREISPLVPRAAQLSAEEGAKAVQLAQKAARIQQEAMTLAGLRPESAQGLVDVTMQHQHRLLVSAKRLELIGHQRVHHIQGQDWDAGVALGIGQPQLLQRADERVVQAAFGLGNRIAEPVIQNHECRDNAENVDRLACRVGQNVVDGRAVELLDVEGAQPLVHGVHELVGDSVLLSLVGAEQHPPYKRPILTKGLWKGAPEDKLWRAPTAGVDLVTEDIAKPLSETGGAIVEVNAGPGLLMHLKPAGGAPQPVGQAIIDHLFAEDENGRIPIVGVAGSKGT